MTDFVSNRSAASRGLLHQESSSHLPSGGPDEVLPPPAGQVPLRDASFLPGSEQVAIPGEPLILPGDDIQHLTE